MYYIEIKYLIVIMIENQIIELRIVYLDCLNLYVYRKFVFNFLGYLLFNICFCFFYFSMICLVVENKIIFI